MQYDESPWESIDNLRMLVIQKPDTVIVTYEKTYTGPHYETTFAGVAYDHYINDLITTGDCNVKAYMCLPMPTIAEKYAFDTSSLRLTVAEFNTYIEGMLQETSNYSLEDACKKTAYRVQQLMLNLNKIMAFTAIKDKGSIKPNEETEAAEKEEQD